MTKPSTRSYPVWILWGVAALLMLPPFLPVGYTFILFCMRLVAAVAFLVLAYRGFKTWRQPAMQTPQTVHTAAQACGAFIAVAGSIYVAFQGYELVAPNHRHIQAAIETLLQEQGTDIASEYTDVQVSDIKCWDWGNRWPCKFNVSYTLTSSGETYTGPRDELEFSRPSGEILRWHKCELNFQWSQRLRKTPYYDGTLEPIEWSGCTEISERRDKNNFTYANYIQNIQGQRIQNGISIKYSDSDKDTTKLNFPIRESFFEDYLNTKIKKAACEDLTYKPEAQSMSCFISGTKVIWETDGVPGFDGLGSSKGQVTGAFTQGVTVATEGLRWVIK